ncbi:hypothetical protein [Bacillus thuringiensis]|uniref:hypothetical protein n=1 Tax=Bacillus thuringiensis TaxID=1428 RepID=UPI0020D2157B|nr:hypothetical protein [Bacillus thuringiensis]
MVQKMHTDEQSEVQNEHVGDYKPFDFPELLKDANEPLILGPAGETFDFIQTGKTTGGQILICQVGCTTTCWTATSRSSLDR